MQSKDDDEEHSEEKLSLSDTFIYFVKFCTVRVVNRVHVKVLRIFRKGSIHEK